MPSFPKFETYYSAFQICYIADALTSNLDCFDIRYPLFGTKGLIKEAIKFSSIQNESPYSIKTDLTEYGFNIDVVDCDGQSLKSGSWGKFHDLMGLRGDDGILNFLKSESESKIMDPAAAPKKTGARFFYEDLLAEFSEIHEVRKFIDVMISPLIHFHFFSMEMIVDRSVCFELNRYNMSYLRIPNEKLF